MSSANFHALRLLVGIVLDLNFAKDLDCSDADTFYHFAPARKIVLSGRTKETLKRLHPGALPFFTHSTTGGTMARGVARRVAAFVDTIPVLPLNDDTWKERLGEYKHDLLYCAKRAPVITFS
jgi:hypothetical protein